MLKARKAPVRRTPRAARTHVVTYRGKDRVTYSVRVIVESRGGDPPAQHNTARNCIFYYHPEYTFPSGIHNEAMTQLVIVVTYLVISHLCSVNSLTIQRREMYRKKVVGVTKINLTS